MPVTITISAGVTLLLDETTADVIAHQLSAAGFAARSNTITTSATALADSDPAWLAHSGGSAHFSDPEWTMADLPLAREFYRSLNGKVRLFVDLLTDHPGTRLSARQLDTMSGDAFGSSYAVAGTLKGLVIPTRRAHRRYPFYWWKGSPTTYAMKPQVAKVFNAARSPIDPE